MALGLFSLFLAAYSVQPVPKKKAGGVFILYRPLSFIDDDSDR